MKKIIAMAALCLAVTSAKAQYTSVSVQNACGGTLTVDIVLEHIPSCSTFTVFAVGTVPPLATRPFTLGAGPLAPYNNVDYQIIGADAGPGPVGLPFTTCGPTGLPPNSGAGVVCASSFWDFTAPIPNGLVKFL